MKLRHKYMYLMKGLRIYLPISFRFWSEAHAIRLNKRLYIFFKCE